MVILEKSGKCPEALKFISEPLAAIIPAGAGESKAAAVTVAEEKKEVKPAGPVTREWYVKKCSELVDMYVNNQSEKQKFLEQVDAVWLTVCYPETAEERAAFENLCKTFAGIDEYFRNTAAREELAKQHLDKIAAVVQKRLEEARRQQEYQAQQQRLREERERLERENEARRIAEAEREQQNYNELKKQLSGLKEKLAYGVVLAIVKNDFTVLEKVSSETAQELQMTVFVTDRENALKQDLVRFNREWKSEVEKFVKAKKTVEQIAERHNVLVIFSFGNAIIVSCKPGDIRYRDRNDKIIKLNLDQLSARDRNMFFRTLERRCKISDPAFVFGLLGNNVKSSDVPAGFWKRNWPLFEKALKRL